ncbi:MAG: HDOD domain-containing protein [Syntrophobacterales bacterium]|nr:HDOD domain-containing protein [Syntrophobacterales bacterium]
MLLCRRPIFDARLKVWAYELLGSEGALTSPAQAQEVHPLWAPETGRPGTPLWLQVAGEFFRGGPAGDLPAARLILELDPPAARNPEVRRSLAAWTAAGYRLALSWPPPSPEAGWEDLPVSLLKVDGAALSGADRTTFAAGAGSRPWALVAAGLTHPRQFREAVAAGCTYAQGSFYRRREEGAPSPARRFAVNYVTILNELGQATLNFPRFAALIQSNPPLVHRLLHYLNSAFFGLPCRVHSVEQALLLLGEEELRKWAALVIIHHLGEGHPEELFLLSLIRARLAERLAELARVDSGPEMFLTGLLSLLDVYLGRPLEALLTELPLCPVILDALKGVPGPQRRVLDLVMALEEAHWQETRELAAPLGIPEAELTAAYLDALRTAEAARSHWLG